MTYLCVLVLEINPLAENCLRYDSRLVWFLFLKYRGLAFLATINSGSAAAGRWRRRRRRRCVTRPYY
jgi:hypothetical protein